LRLAEFRDQTADRHTPILFIDTAITVGILNSAAGLRLIGRWLDRRNPDQLSVGIIGTATAHSARHHGVREDAVARMARGQADREEHVRRLRLPVREPRIVAAIPEVHVVEHDRRHEMRIRAHRHDARVSRCGERIVQGEGRETVVIQFTMSEDDVETNLRHPAVMVGSDGIPVLEGLPHPRLFGTFPRVLGRYVRDRGVAPLEQMVRRMTCLFFTSDAADERPSLVLRGSSLH